VLPLQAKKQAPKSLMVATETANQCRIGKLARGSDFAITHAGQPSYVGFAADIRTAMAELDASPDCKTVAINYYVQGMTGPELWEPRTLGA
jgi:hypothetical protein